MSLFYSYMFRKKENPIVEEFIASLNQEAIALLDQVITFRSTRTEEQIYNSKGELHNSCPYIDEIRDYLMKEKADPKLLKTLEYIRAINDGLRNGKTDKIDYDLIGKKIYETTDNSKLQDQIDDLNYENKKLYEILEDVSKLSPRIYRSLDYSDLRYDLEQEIKELKGKIEDLN